jgi:beta-galactosidase
VEEYGMIPDTVMGLQVDETLISSGAFYEILSPVDAKAVGIWKNKSPDEYNAASDKPAIVCRRFGQGWAIYVGTYLTTYNVASIINVVLRKTTLQLQPLANAPAAVEIMIRYNAERKLIFLINHASIPQTVENLPEGLELIGQRNTGNSIVLEPYGVRVIKTRRDGEQY